MRGGYADYADVVGDYGDGNADAGVTVYEDAAGDGDDGKYGDI